jgi:microcystin degradation protein MlrC
MPPIRIAALQFSHETVTFLPNDTRREDFIYPGSPAAGEALLATDPAGYMGGFVKVAREHEGVELTGIESPLFPVTGTGSGWVTADAFEYFTSRMIEQLTAQGPFDGVYLCLHGAMAVRGTPHPEAELARRVRAAVGPKARLAGTFDPHGNEDDQFLRHADLAFCVKYFPHYDSRLQGERAARMLIRAITGDYAPTPATVKVPILTPTVMQWTGASPWMDLVQRALVWEAREPDLYVNVFFGFPWSDVPDTGMTIQATANANPALAKRAADDLAAYAWRRRAELISAAHIHSMSEGTTLAAHALAAGATPIVLADHSDRSGAATWLLQAILDSGLSDTVIATIADRDTVIAHRNARPGTPFSASIGGRLDPSAGDPVPLTGTIEAGDWSHNDPARHWMSIRFGRNNLVVLTPYLTQIMDPKALTRFAIDPADHKAFAIKSRVHFRRGFDDSGFAPTILLVEPDQPFLGTIRLEALPYANVTLTDFYPYADR